MLFGDGEGWSCEKVRSATSTQLEGGLLSFSHGDAK